MSCSTESLIPSWVTIGVGSLMLIFLIATSLYSYKLLKKDNGWNDKGFKSKIKCWVKDIWGRKSCYIPIISHLADTTTDFAAVAELYIISKETTKDECGGLNIWYLFALSVSCMVIYRIVSSSVIYQLTRSWTRVCTQFIDIELFRILYVSHKYKLSKSSSPQRLISTLEAVFEAAPQALIQLIFLMKTDGLSAIIMLSVVLSLFNLTLSTVSDDKMLEGFTKSSYGQPFGWKEKVKKISLLYLFRFCDIPSQILCLCLFWVLINGYALTIIICIDFVIIFIFYWKTNKSTDALMGLIALPLSFGDKADLELFFLWFYRFLWCIAVNITLWIYFASYISSNQQSVFIVALWSFASFGSIIKFPLLFAMYKVVGHEWYKTSKERSNMTALCEKELFEDVMELMFYIHSTPNCSDVIMSFDNKPYATLLWVIYKLCDDRNDWTLFNIMLEKDGIDICDYELCDTALHAICGYTHLESEENCILAGKLLKKATIKYLTALNRRGESVFMCMAHYSSGENLPLCDMIWQKFNELCSANDIAVDEKEDDVNLVNNVNNAKIEYLNTVVPPEISYHTGWHTLQFAVESNASHFFRKFLSLYPTEESKRDIIFRTDFNDDSWRGEGKTSLLLQCAKGVTTKCSDILWEAIDDFCGSDEDGNDIKIKYLNVQKENGETALMTALQQHDFDTSSFGMFGRDVERNVSGWFYNILNLYPTLQSKQDALKIKNKDGKDALEICKKNNWNDAEKDKTIRHIESILNKDAETENIGIGITNLQNMIGLMQLGLNATEAMETMLYLNKKKPETHDIDIEVDGNSD